MLQQAVPASAQNLGQYGRIQLSLPASAATLEVTGPDHAVQQVRTFTHQPARFEYDEHGWEKLTAAGEATPAARYTPTLAGDYKWRALSNDGQELAAGRFSATKSEHSGYVQISSRDPRYFATTDGRSFAAIGLNLAWPPSYDLPAGGEFRTSGQRGVLGVRDYDRWFVKLQENGGNFVRLWCGAGYFDAQKEEMGRVDALAMNRLDAVVESARKHGIRLKLCMDSFRDMAPAGFMGRQPKDPDSGKACESMVEFLDSPRWRELWLAKIDEYAARYAGDPVVAVIEPWNEMNCVKAPWEKTLAWNAYILPELKKRFPRQLVVNSLGSFDGDWCVKHHADMKALLSQEFDQVHRYLDQGAQFEECHDPVAGSIDAIRRMAQKHRPVLLAETGAVNNSHTGLFRFSRWDDRGIIFHDTTFAPFFAGSAGTGQGWFWESYVDQKNLWPQYKALADVIKGVELDQERFEYRDLSDERVWCLTMVGQRNTLVWLRNRADTWQASLRDQAPLQPVTGVRVEVPKGGRIVTVANAFGDDRGEVVLEGTTLRIGRMYAGVMLRIEHR